MKLKVEINQKIGHWLVLEVLKTSYRALCTACNKTERTIENWKKTNSCGCTRYKYGPPIKNGDIFYNWKVLNIESGKTGKSICICTACNATERIIRNTDLRQGRTKSCGCQAVLARTISMQEKYNVDFYTQSPDFIKKRQVTNMSKYGTIHSSASIEIKQKIKETNLRNHGHTSSLGNPATREKSNKTMIERYETTNTHTINKLLHKDKVLHLSDGRFLRDVCSEYNKNPENAYRIYHTYGEEAFLDYCTNPSKETSIESAFRRIMRTEFPDLEKYDKKPYHIVLNRRPDFFLQKNGKELYINLDGLHSHSELKKDKNYHIELCREFTRCKSQIYQFRSDEIRDRPTIIRSLICNYFNLNLTKIPARKCTLLKVSSLSASQFLEKNHMMGQYKAASYYGLYYTNELVSLIGVQKKDENIEIARYCTKINHSIQGGLSKMLKFITKSYNPKEIISFVDLRYATGHSYKKLEFTEQQITPSWRWTNGVFSYNRLKCRANMDQRKLTQAEYAKEFGWVKIYDAGQAKFTKKMRD